jgi:hypothetical protein
MTDDKGYWSGPCPIHVLSAAEAIRKRPKLYFGENNFEPVLKSIICFLKTYGEIASVVVGYESIVTAFLNNPIENFDIFSQLYAPGGPEEFQPVVVIASTSSAKIQYEYNDEFYEFNFKNGEFVDKCVPSVPKYDRNLIKLYLTWDEKLTPIDDKIINNVLENLEHEGYCVYSERDIDKILGY